MLETQKIALVTGGSSGIGQTTAKALAKSGCKVYEISRRDSRQDGIEHLFADVTDEVSVKTAVNQIIERDGQIDIVVNCAGFGISGAIEFTETSDAKKQFDVNFFGMVNINHAVLPYMREAGKGRIVNISSVAAGAHLPFQAYYSASKAAMDSYTCALANEVRPFGITATAVQPGDICTGFTDAREKVHTGDEIYGGRIGKSVAQMEKDERNGMKPDKAGGFIARVALKKNVKPLYVIGGLYKFLYLLIKFLPCRTRNYLVGMIYAKW